MPAMSQLLASPARRGQMGAAARKWVSEPFPQARIHALSVALYKDLRQGHFAEPASARIRAAATVAD